MLKDTVLRNAIDELELLQHGEEIDEFMQKGSDLFYRVARKYGVPHSTVVGIMLDINRGVEKLKDKYPCIFKSDN